MSTQSVARRAHPVRPSRLRWRPSERLVFGLMGFVVILTLWETASRLGIIKKFVLTSPTLIVEAAIKDTPNAWSWPHLQASATELVAGFVFAMAIGVPLGLAIGMYRRLNHLLDPWLSAIYATPT